MNNYKIGVGSTPRERFWKVVAVLMTVVACGLAFVSWHVCAVNPCDWAGYDNDPANAIPDGNYVCTYDLGLMK